MYTDIIFNFIILVLMVIGCCTHRQAFLAAFPNVILNDRDFLATLGWGCMFSVGVSAFVDIAVAL